MNESVSADAVVGAQRRELLPSPGNWRGLHGGGGILSQTVKMRLVLQTGKITCTFKHTQRCLNVNKYL